MLSDQILDPGLFPFQHSESEMVAFEVKNAIRNCLEAHLYGEMSVISAVALEEIRKAQPPVEEYDEEE